MFFIIWFFHTFRLHVRCHELLYRSTLDLSMTIEEKDFFKTKLKDIALSSFKLFNENCQFENKLSAEEINLLKALLTNKNIIEIDSRLNLTRFFYIFQTYFGSCHFQSAIFTFLFSQSS